MTHIWVSKLITIILDIGLSPGRCQAIFWAIVRILSIEALGKKISEILIEIYKFSSYKTYLKISWWHWRPFLSRLQCIKPSYVITTITSSLYSYIYTILPLRRTAVNMFWQRRSLSRSLHSRPLRVIYGVNIRLIFCHFLFVEYYFHCRNVLYNFLLWDLTLNILLIYTTFLITATWNSLSIKPNLWNKNEIFDSNGL